MSNCQHCRGLANLLERAVEQGLKFSTEERRVLLARAQDSLVESTRQMQDRLLRMPLSNRSIH
jgi:hypothetical protein